MQNALETMESTNKQLRAIIARHKVDPNLNVNPLSMKLQGIIDAAVMGGVSNYEKVRYICVPLTHPPPPSALSHACFDLWQAFLTPEFVKENPDSADYVEKLKSSLVEQVRTEV